MLKPMIRTIDRLRFELPLALVFGAAAAFAVIVMPPELFHQIPRIDNLGDPGLVQTVAGGFAGVIAFVVGYLAMRKPARLPAPSVWAEMTEVPVAEDPQVRLRRADLHPDAPPRQPIRASRDLGEPFMEVGGFAPAEPVIPHGDFVELEIPESIKPVAAETAPAEPPLAEPIAEQIMPAPLAPEPETEATPIAPPAFVAETEAETVTPPEPVAEAIDIPAAPEPVVASPAAEIAPEPVADTAPAPESAWAHEPLPLPKVQAPSPIEAFLPEHGTTPAPARATRPSLGSMMERLSTGLERRGGRPVAPPPAAVLAEALAGPRDSRPELRDALSELNLLAGRRD